MSDKDSFLNRKGTGLSLSGRRKTDPVGLKKQLIVSYRLEIKDVAAWLKARFPENENEINAMAELDNRFHVMLPENLSDDELDDIYKMRKEDENQYDPLDGF